MENIKNIVFDLGVVLMDLDREGVVKAMKRIGFPQAEGLINSHLQKGIFRQLEEGNATEEEFFSYVRDHSTEEPSDEQIRDAFNAFLVGIPQYKLDMLLELRKRFNIYMLSNNNPVSMAGAEKFFTTQGLAIDDYFDRIFISYKMKLLKPGKEIFLKMMEDTGMMPAETLFIDDAPANTATARELGFHTYQPVPQEDFRKIFDTI